MMKILASVGESGGGDEYERMDGPSAKKGKKHHHHHHNNNNNPNRRHGTRLEVSVM